MKKVLVVEAPAERDAYQRLADAAPDATLSFAATTGQAAEQLAGGSFDVVIAAHDPPEFDALRLLPAGRSDSSPPVIVVAARPNVEWAQAALRGGASDFVVKPINVDELAHSVKRLLDQRDERDERALLRRRIERPFGFEEFIGGSPAMRKVFATIEQVAESGVDVLIRGETGTGKELVARSIHRRSRRADRPFVPVDCGAIPENLLESEFFGHEKGAFTGAENRRVGLIEFANGGTFFLDELGELPLLLQAKLLRTLQERRIRRVGGREEIDVDVRIVAATSRNLEDMIRQKLFREDLYYRVNVVSIDLPRLRDRGDDLGLLAERFVVRYSREMGKNVTGITPEAYQVLRAYDWPGNVRELQNVVRRSIALTQDTLVGLNDLPESLVVSAGDHTPGGESFFEARDQRIAEFEHEYLTNLLARHAGNVKTAAAEAKLPRGTLYRLMKNHGLDSADYRAN